MKNDQLAGATAVVTGAAGRIGRAIALALAARGANVLASDLDAAGLARTAALLGQPHSSIVADLAREAEIGALIDAAVDAFGELSVLVNCGAITKPGGTVLESSIAALDRALAVNIRAPYLAVRAALPHMLAQGHGTIVNVASVQGLIAVTGFAPYAVSKAGLLQLTRQVAVEYGSRGIRCNAVCPGATRSLDETADEADLSQFTKVIGRTARTTEIAEVVAFLASERASFINGAIVPVDGGFTAC